MFSLVKLAVVLTAALSVAAMPSHMARDSHNHREIAARVAQPEPVHAAEIEARDMAVPAKRFTRRKRASNGRCKPKKSSDTPSSTVKGDPESTPEPKTSPEPKEALKPTSSPPKDDPEPTTTTTEKPETTTTPKPTPSPTPAPDSGSGGGEVLTGQGTFYSTGLGACGIVNKDSDFIAAVSHLFFDTYPGYDGANPNKNPMCGKTARVTYKGKTVTVKLVDRCEGCARGDLDFSPHAFNQLATPAEGRISGISWQITG